MRDEIGTPYGDRLLSLVMLNVLDEKWKDHLYDLDQLRNAIHVSRRGARRIRSSSTSRKRTRCSWTS